ncbi:MAG: RNA polymerase sigma factor [Candidatus Flemingiibacterium sp.]
MTEFETLLSEHRSAVEKFVQYRMKPSDADDILQEVYLAAFRAFGRLSDRAKFKPWILGIARRKCADWLRLQYGRREISLDTLEGRLYSHGCMRSVGTNIVGTNIVGTNIVLDTLDSLGEDERNILSLCYFGELTQKEIAERLGIPLGTVKSRLHYAREKFRDAYPQKPKGRNIMTKLPEILPDYTIIPTADEPFEVVCEELDGWLLVPREGERLSFGLYDMPKRARTEYADLEVVGRAEIHGIAGVEIRAVQHDAENYYRTGSVDELERRFVAQLTDTHVRFLAESHFEDGVRKLYTFLDGDRFLDNWGFGEDNIGREILLSRKGIISRSGNTAVSGSARGTVDVTDRCTVKLGGRSYDTIRVMDIECFNDAVASEAYIDKNGRTVLWRRFNRDDWAKGRYGRLWSDMLPSNERLIINGETYVHWYDCVSDYIF